MKRMQCELCGSSELVKDGDFFVCQGCGTKYSLENARKLFVEGTVKIDSSDNLPRFLRLANEAFDSKNWAKAEEYAGKVLEIDDSNAEAWLIQGEAIDWQCTVKNDRLLEALRSYRTYINLMIGELKSATDKDALQARANQLSDYIDDFVCNARAEIGMYCNAYKSSINQPGYITSMLNDHYQARIQSLELILDAVNEIESLNNEADEGEDRSDDNVLGKLSSLARTTMLTVLKVKLTMALGIGGFSAKDSLPLYISDQCNKAQVHAFKHITNQWDKIHVFEYWGEGKHDYSHESEQFDSYINILDGNVEICIYCTNVLEAANPIRIEYYNLLNTIWGNASYIEKVAIDARTNRAYHNRFSSGLPTSDGFYLTDKAKELRRKKVEEYQSNADKYDFVKLLSAEVERYKVIESSCKQRVFQKLELALRNAHPSEAERKNEIHKQLDSLNAELNSLKDTLKQCGLFERARRKELNSTIERIAAEINGLKDEEKMLGNLLSPETDWDSFKDNGAQRLSINPLDGISVSEITTILENVLEEFASRAQINSESSSVEITVGPCAARALSDLLEDKAAIQKCDSALNEIFKYAPRDTEWTSLEQATDYIMSHEDN